MGILNKIFFGTWEKKAPVFIHKKRAAPTIEEFPMLNANERFETIVALGDTGKMEYFPFLKYAILTDTDQSVKFAALKRIHLFKENEEVVPILTQIKNDKSGEKFEPYFSMALSRLGIITLKEFEEIVNNSK